MGQNYESSLVLAILDYINIKKKVRYLSHLQINLQVFVHSLLFSHENNLLFLSAINKGPSVIKICKTLEQQATHTCYAWENLIINLPYISFESFSIFIKNNTTLHVSHTSFYALIKIRQWVAKCENKTPSCVHNKDLISAQNAFNHSTNAPMWTKFIHVYLVFQIIKNKNQ